MIGTGASAEIITAYNPAYEITEETLKMMSEKNITAMRIYFGNSLIIISIKEKIAKKITKAVNCILN